MSDEHDHSPHEHDHAHQHAPPAVPSPAPAPERAPADDASTEALAEALRSSFAIVKVVMFLLFVLFIFSGFFYVKEGKRAVILHFGKPVGAGNAALLGPGLHAAFPRPIDEVVYINYAQLQQVKSTVGWYNTTSVNEALDQEPPATPTFNPAVDGYAITGDGNLINTRATLTYRIDDPIQYEFGFTSTSNAVRNALDNALLFAAARFKVDDVLTRDITRFQDMVTARVTDLAQKENLGIVVENCQVESRPPRYLKTAFDGVLAALSTRDKDHNDALAYENQHLSLAAAQAASRTNEAEADRVRLVQSVQAEAQRFSDLLPRYTASPTLFTSILLSEKIGQVLTNVQDKIFLPERADGKPRELRLQLSREPAKPPGSP
jgi:membrane protease subunit HflK